MIAKLAIKDIRNEWLLSTCLVLAVASIIAPLLILFGLKYGTIQTLRTRLVEDPKNREMRPVSSASYTKPWFDTVRNMDGVSFIVPMTRQISSSVEAVVAGKKKVRMALLATSPGDPLLRDNGTGDPGEGECVLTHRAAEKLGAVIGDTLTLTIRRSFQGRKEKEALGVRVVGILNQRASGVKSLFVRLDILEAVEEFKDGRAVPRYGWKGHEATAYPVFDGAVVLISDSLTKSEQLQLINNTGFSNVRRLERKEVKEKSGYPLAESWSAYFVFVEQQAVEIESIQAVRHHLRKKKSVVVPWVKPLSVELRSVANSKASSVNLLSGWFEENPSGGLSLPDNAKSIQGSTANQLIILPQENMFPDGPAVLKLQEKERTLLVPVEVIHGQTGGRNARAVSPFVGSLNLFRYRDISYNPTSKALLLSRRGYAGFRLYTKNIDVVESVRKQLEDQGVEVHAESVRIAEVQRLDLYLSRIFWIIALVGVLGGIAALSASLYASVERKKKELNILRLIGCYKMEVLRFPIYQGLVLAVGGLALAGVFFLLVARIINTLFRSHLGESESLCTLEPEHFFILLIAVSGLSILAAATAAIKATTMDPAEALRDE